MLDPVGPLPPAVYWRRRAVALIAIVLSVLLIFWIASTIANADSDPSGAAAGSSSSSAAGTSGSADDEPSSPTAADEPSSTASASADASASSAAGDTGVGSAAATSPAAPTTSTAPAAPGVCAAESIKVTVSANTNAFIKGDKPKLVLSVVNAGAEPCYRDLNAAGQELTVWDGSGARLWSSNDCYPEKSDDTRLLQPGQKADFHVVWSGKVSEPTCTQPRPLLGAGYYYLLAAQDGVVSELVPFSISDK